MAALSLGHSYLHKNKSSIQGLKPRNCSSILVVISCQRGESVDISSPKEKKEMKQEKQLILRQIFGSAEKFGGRLKDTLSPKQKGDWKDVVLMSLAFAVYVYISQQIVSAYCAWTSMLTQSW